MSRRKVIVKQTAADSISSIAWFIESKGLIATADNLQITYTIILSELLINEDHILFAYIRNRHYWGINAFHIKRNIQLYLLRQKVK